MRTPDRSLRILVIVNLPWDGRLGASRVWIELAREWEDAGHKVEHFCLTDAFPAAPRSRFGSAFQQLTFPARAASFVRRNADRYDIIDCLIGTLAKSKESLGFNGLLVARSVGLFRLYDQFLQDSEKLWPDQPRGRWFGRLLHRFLEWRNRSNSEAAIRFCDLINVPNNEEFAELAQDAKMRGRILVEPYGLSDDFREALAKNAAPAAERLTHQTICFIGMWGPRKGSLDWPGIITRVRQEYPAARFLLLGTMFDENIVLKDLGSGEGITCRPTFTESELPALLTDCTLALFPSYIEGFGLAVLEQLAAGLPTIAYDVPGPRQVLASLRDRLLVPTGDVAMIATRACEILGLALEAYTKLSTDCIAIAGAYRWSEIALRTVEQYRTFLDSLG